MAQYIRFQVELNGFSGAPGINTWCAMEPGLDGIDGFSDQIRAFYDGMKGYMPNDVKVTMQPIATIHEIGDNALVEQKAITAWSVTGSDEETYTSRATQAKLRFYTDRVRRNRMLQGGIFFGPVGDQALNGDGTIKQAFKDAVTTHVGGLLDVAGAMRLCVYSQPKDQLLRPDGTIKFPAASGETGYVQSVGVMPVPAVLRSRRD